MPDAFFGSLGVGTENDLCVLKCIFAFFRIYSQIRFCFVRFEIQSDDFFVCSFTIVFGNNEKINITIFFLNERTNQTEESIHLGMQTMRFQLRVNFAIHKT